MGKIQANLRRTNKKDRRGRNLRLSLRDYHSLPLIIAQFQASCKRLRKGSPILPKTIPLKTISFVESCKRGRSSIEKALPDTDETDYIKLSVKSTQFIC